MCIKLKVKLLLKSYTFLNTQYLHNILIDKNDTQQTNYTQNVECDLHYLTIVNSPLSFPISIF